MRAHGDRQREKIIVLFVTVSECSCLRLASNSEPEPAHPPAWMYCTAPGCPPVGDDKESEAAKDTGAPQEFWSSSNNCRLRYALDSLGKGNVSFTVLGGSATAGAGLEDGELNWFQRFERLVNASNTATTFNNAAQGGTESFWGASMMDSIAGDADVLFWEYAINDVKGASTGRPMESPESMRQGIEFFIRKGLQLPSRPALVFVYLYDAAGHYDSHSFHSTALTNQNPVIKKFADAGADILIIPVAEAMRDNVDEMNNHHPGPRAHTDIAQLVWNEMQLAAANTRQACSPKEYEPSAAAAVKSPVGLDVASDSFLDKLQRMNSLSGTPILPRFGKSSFKTDACKLIEGGPEHAYNCSEVVLDIFGKEEPVRADRKIGYDIPLCTGDRFLRVKLDGVATEYSSGAVGIHAGGGEYHQNAWSHEIRVRVDDQEPVTLRSSSAPPFDKVFNNWIPLGVRHNSSQVLTLTFCMPEENATGNWQDLVWSPFHNGGGRLDWISVFTDTPI